MIWITRVSLRNFCSGGHAGARSSRASQPSRPEARYKVVSCCYGDVAASRRMAGEHLLLDELAYLVGKQAKVADAPILAVDFLEAWLLSI